MDETSGDQLEIGEYGWQMGFGGEKGKGKVCCFNPYAFCTFVFLLVPCLELPILK